MEEPIDFDDDFVEDEPLLEDLETIPAGAFDLPSAPQGLEAELLRRTTSVVRANRRRRRIAGAAAAVLVYAVGFGTARLVGLESGGPPLPVPRGTAAEDAAFRGEFLVADAEFSRDPASLAPEEIERRADSASPEERRRLLELAGNRFLDDEANVEAAMRCYRSWLAVAGDEDLTPDADDSWLLIALKRSRVD